MKINIIIFVLLSVIQRETFALREQKLTESVNYLIQEKEVSSQCAKSLKLYMNRLNSADEKEIWALQMLDATSKIPVSLLSYSFTETGNFKECIEIESKRDQIRGQYCLGKVRFNSTIATKYSGEIGSKLYLKYILKDIAYEDYCEVQHPSWAMCLPSDCSNEDAKRIMSKAQTLGATIGSVTCQTIEDVYPPLDGGSVIGISIFSILFLIVIASTVYDIHCQKKKIKSDSPIYIAFSLYTNGKKLFETTSRSSPLSCLDGIRVISTLWVIFFHTYEAYVSGPVFNPKNVVNLTNYLLSMVTLSASLACDTFFTVGGTLVTYSFFKKGKKADISFGSLMKYYFHRYIRLTPPLAGLILVCATLTKYLGSGPRWPDIVRWYQNTCVNYWWSSLLYLQNAVNVDEPCTPHTWYLDIDMQLYILSPFVLWMLQKFTKTGILVLILGILVSMVNAFFIAYDNRLSALWGELHAVTPLTEFLTKYYYKTESRAATWLIGLVLGYMLTKKEFTEIRAPKKFVIPMWILSITVMLLCVFGGHINLKGPEYARLQNSLHIALVRPAFALAICWMIWACGTNHGGIINSLLSLPIFTFMMKFTFSMYVVHVFMVFAISFASKTAVHITAFNVAYWFWGNFMLVFGVSIIWVLVFESPMMVLEGILFQKLGAKSKAE